MKLSRLAVNELRQFTTRFELLDLGPGLNLISGANETGKSALVRALQAAFFERYSTKAVEDLRPWQDSNAAPEVQVDFEHQGNQYQLVKRFLKKSQCRLRAGSVDYEGEQAETLLQDLLGFRYPGKGASKEEHWGIPGLLWITQGSGQDLARPIRHAHDFLRESLSQGLEDIASSAGDALIDEIAADRGLLLTATGKPTGELKKRAAEAEEARQALVDTEQKMRQYQQAVDRLAIVRGDWQQAEESKPWADAERRQAEATRQLQAVNLQRQTLTRNQAELTQAQSEQCLIYEQLGQWQQERQQLKTRTERLQELQTRLEQTQRDRNGREARLAEADARLRAAESTLVEAEEARRRHDLEAQVKELQQTIEREQKQLERARDEQEKRRKLQQTLTQDRLDSAQVEALAACEETLRRLESKRDAVATRVSYRLAAGKELMLGKTRLQGEGETTLIEASTLHLAGLGELRIEPGGQDLAALAAEQREAERVYHSRLAQLKVESVAQARRRLADQREAEQQLRWYDQTLRDLAPAGIDALAAGLEARQTQLQQQRESLQLLVPALTEAMAESPMPPPTVAAARDGCTLARQQQAALAGQVQAAREQDVATRTELNGAQTEHQELAARIADDGRRTREQGSQKRLLELGASIDRLQQDISAQQAAIDSANPQLLEDDIQRYGRAGEVSRAAQRERVTEIARLEGALGAEGAASLAAEWAEQQARCERLARHRSSLEKRASALDLLHQRLQQKRLALVEHLQAPLQKHIAGYLRILFPESRLQISEAFQPGRLARADGVDVDFEVLSFGAREQVGVVLRLAYADALKEAGRPTLIVLDDALVHSDKQRREAMQQVLYSAARRHQILLFTCHPDNWSDLGVPVRALEKLKAEAGL